MRVFWYKKKEKKEQQKKILRLICKNIKNEDDEGGVIDRNQYPHCVFRYGRQEMIATIIIFWNV